MPTRWPSILLVFTVLSACSGTEGEPPLPYRAVAVPRARLASPEARSGGSALFVTYCAQCHGERADGHGPRRDSLTTMPADFTNRAWRRSTTPRRVFWHLTEGVRGTDMPAWKALTEEERWDLVAYLLSVAEEGP